MEWLQILQTVGVPVFALIAFAYAVWRAIVWLGTNIAQPLVQKHIAFLDAVSTNVEKQARAVESMALAREGEIDRYEAITNKLEAIHRALTEVQTMVISTKTVQIVPGGHVP